VPFFEKSVWIAASPGAVFRFHERPDALPLLTPKFPPVRMISRSGDGISVGTRVELRVVVFHWIAVHTVYEQDRLFVDEQVQGPFAKWIHRHEFSAEGSGTRLTDRIEFVLPGGELVNKLLGWAVRPGLKDMFQHRHRVTKQYCETIEK
jgi:ligand-binding SRPBCC domain-containing protein